MDTELLKTFLTVEREGQFGRAAERLYLTPAAVSARIRQLEGLVGIPLFHRSRTHVSLTAAGERLKPYAEDILASWSAALQDSVFAGFAPERFTLGGTPNLWDLALQYYLPKFTGRFPGLLLRAENHDGQFLITQLLARQLDMALLFDPLRADEFSQQAIFNVSLEMVSTTPGLSAEDAFGMHYVQVDWSNDFSIKHQRLAGRRVQPRLATNSGRIALAYLLAKGGSAFLPYGMAAEHIRRGSLHAVPTVPVIEQVVYAVFRKDNQQGDVLRNLLELMKSQTPTGLLPLDE